MKTKLKNILHTLSEQEGEEVVSFFVKLDALHLKAMSYRQFKRKAMAEIQAALKNQANKL
jgi:hypothetical protein